MTTAHDYPHIEHRPDGRTREDGGTGPAWGFVDPTTDIFIWDPTLSPCGRFPVDPVFEYGLTPAEARRIADLNSSLT
jgi:hypothetical protein